MRRVHAHEQLSDPALSSRLTIEGFYQLMRQAGYSDEVATDATNERSWNRLQAGETI